jgi:hypothetical protein
MTIPDKKNRAPIVPTRTPKKKTAGIFDNLRKMPQPHPVEEMLGLKGPNNEPVSEPVPGGRASTPSRGSTPSTPSILQQPAPKPGVSTSISPERDFTKVANSIVRAAVPAGFFGENGGKSKQLYDYLYSQTRGAIVPRRKIRMPKEKLMKGSGIGSEVTLRKNLQRLRETGLVNEEIVPGAHGGNEYEVLMPEEVGMTGSTPSTPSTPSTGSSPLYLREGVDPLEDRGSRPSLSQADATTYGEDKTFIKDLSTNDDDEAFAEMVALLKRGAKEVTGKETQAVDRERWRELGELMVMELKIAAARTTVSSAPAFLAEHLRRRLWKKDQREWARESKTSPTASNRSEEEVRKCPDCGGSGMYYPQGYEKGVARCKHERLAKEDKHEEGTVENRE